MSVSRRHFLKSSGALIVSFSASSLTCVAQGPFDTHPSHIDPAKLDSWIAIADDDTVTGYTGKCDLGQGMFTDPGTGPTKSVPGAPTMMLLC